MKTPDIVIVTPALAAANNGNWQTARRWAQLLSRNCRVHVTDRWEGGAEQVMIALHARRSAASIQAWSRASPRRPLAVVLTGTDLYGDIATDALMQQSLQAADRLVVLNELGAQQLPAPWRPKVDVCLPSCSLRQVKHKSGRHLRAVMVGHLREEKSPQTFFEAARLLMHRDDILLDHIGGALDPRLGEQAQQLAKEDPRYRWLGPLSHEQARTRIQSAHVLVHPSRLEGGAHAIIEALRSGTPVIASRIDGNLGLLGADYAGLFEWNHADQLAALLIRARDDASLLSALQTQCAQRASLFDPEQERRSLLALVGRLLRTRQFSTTRHEPCPRRHALRKLQLDP